MNTVSTMTYDMGHMHIHTLLQYTESITQQCLTKTKGFQDIKFCKTILTQLCKLGLWGHYSVVSFLLGPYKKQSFPPPLPIDFHYGSMFTSHLNIEYIEKFITQRRSDLLLWGYNIYYHDKFVELANKYIKPTATNFKFTYFFIIRPKYTNTAFINIHMIEGYSKLIDMHLALVKTLTNFQQILDGNEFSTLDNLMMFKNLFTEKNWFKGSIIEERDDIITKNISNMVINERFTCEVANINNKEKENVQPKRNLPKPARKMASMSKVVHYKKKYPIKDKLNTFQMKGKR